MGQVHHRLEESASAWERGGSACLQYSGQQLEGSLPDAHASLELITFSHTEQREYFASNAVQPHGEH